MYQAAKLPAGSARLQADYTKRTGFYTKTPLSAVMANKKD